MPAAPALAAGPLPAPVGVVHLHDAAQRHALVALLHHLQELVLHLPSRVPAHAQLPRQFQRRNAVPALRQQVERQEPDGQRQLGGDAERAGDEGGLAVAGMALPELAGADAAVPSGAALRAAEAVRPAGVEDSLLALPLAAVALQELARAESLLELHAIAVHLLAPFLSEISDLLQ